MISSVGKKQGFTLLELLVVIVILSVSATLVAPYFRGFFSGYQLDDTACRLLSVVRYAASRSSIEGLKYRLEYNMANNTCQLTCESNPLSEPGNFKNLGNPWGKEIILPQEVQISEVSMGDKVYQKENIGIIFYSGRLEENVLIILENKEGDKRQVFIRGFTGTAKILPRESSTQ